MSSNTFAQHSLFKKNIQISSKSDLINDKLNKHGEKIILDIALSNIESMPQVRKTFEVDKIKRLAEDIQINGMIHPITIMKHPKKENKYVLLIGGNRVLACKYLNQDTIPCIVKDYQEDQAKNSLIQLAENMHRMDLNPVELAEAVMRIKEKTGYTLSQLAKRLGRTIDSLKQYSRINKLSETEKHYHIENKSTKNEILMYLAEREFKKPKRTEKTQSLFKQIQTNPYQNLPKDDLLKKIKEAEDFLKIAKKLIKK
jgi:ParB/RepB/Spo0J family partition protein